MGMTRLFCVIFLCSRIFAYDNQVRANYTSSPSEMTTGNISDWTRNNFRRERWMGVHHVDDPADKFIPRNYEESDTIDPAYSVEGRSGSYNYNWNPRNNTLKKWLLSLVRVETDTLENFMRIYRVQIFYDLMFSFVKWSFYAYWAWFLP